MNDLKTLRIQPQGVCAGQQHDRANRGKAAREGCDRHGARAATEVHESTDGKGASADDHDPPFRTRWKELDRLGHDLSRSCDDVPDSRDYRCVMVRPQKTAVAVGACREAAKRSPPTGRAKFREETP